MLISKCNGNLSFYSERYITYLFRRATLVNLQFHELSVIFIIEFFFIALMVCCMTPIFSIQITTGYTDNILANIASFS